MTTESRRVRGLAFRVIATVAVATLLGFAGSAIGDNRGRAVDQRDHSDGNAASSLAFVDVAAEVGLDFTHDAFRWGLSADPVAMMGGGVCWLDYDDDGWLDLYLVNSYAEAEWAQWNAEGGVPTSRLYRNVEGEFTDVTDTTASGLALRGLGCVAGDIDADGDTDLYITSATSNALLLNQNGVFEDIAETAGVGAYGWHTSATMGDLDGDGLIDLFVAGYVNLIRPVAAPTQGFPGTYEALGDLVYHNLGNDDAGRPRFEEVGRPAGIEPGGPSYGLGSVLTDVDADGDLDLYVANDTNPNQLYINDSTPGSIHFIERGRASGVDDPFSGMGVSAADMDRDGLPDIAVTNLGTQTHGVFGSRGSGSFQSVAATSGLTELEGEYTGWGTLVADFDLDTDLDLMIVNGNVPVMYPMADRQPVQLFTNQLAETGTLSFRLAAESSTFAGLGPLLGRSGAAADFDNDGDLDVVITQVSGRVVLLRNVTAAGHTLTIAFDHFAPGAEVRVTLPDGSWLVRETHAGSSYLASEDPRVQFGLGESSEATLVEVRLPGSGEALRYEHVDANGVLTIRASPP